MALADGDDNKKVIQQLIDTQNKRKDFYNDLIAQLEAGYEAFKIGALNHDIRVEMEMTQEQLAEKVGITKSYISKVENNIKEARISTLQKIIELGFGGRL